MHVPHKLDLKDIAFRGFMIISSLALAIISGLAAWQLSSPTTAPIIIPNSETYYARALSAKTPQAKIDWALKAIHVAPARAENWVLLAYCYQVVDARLSARAIKALEQSYAVAPLSVTAHEPRLTYIFNIWSQLPPDLRKQAHREALAYLIQPSGQKTLEKLSHSTIDPEGRFAIIAIRIEFEDRARLERLNAKPQSP